MTQSRALGRIDIATVRADTPGVNQVTHLNSAGASLPPLPVTESTVAYIQAEARIGGYEAAVAEGDVLERVYVEAATMFGCAEAEIAFQQNASQAWWAAFNSIPLRPGDRILATSSEYVANAMGLISARNRGIDVELIPDDEHGQTSVKALETLLDERVKLVCATHVPTSGGLINPVAEIGAAVKRGSDAFYLLDACQSAGQLPISVDEIQCDFLAVTGRKFLRGPRGTGLLYQRAGLEGLLPPLVLDGWASDWTGPWTMSHTPGARVHELFECSFAAKAGLGVALAYANRLGLDNIAARVQALASILRTTLASIEGVSVADRGVLKSGIVTFDVAGHEPDAVVTALRQLNINTSASRLGAAQFDLAERAPNGLVRASVHYFNTESELDRLAQAVAEL